MLIEVCIFKKHSGEFKQAQQFVKQSGELKQALHFWKTQQGAGLTFSRKTVGGFKQTFVKTAWGVEMNSASL